MGERALRAAAAAYFVAAAIGVEPDALRASADKLAGGQVWVLLTSALDAQGPLPRLQVALAAAVAALVIARDGARLWWGVALAGHVLSALVAYAAIAIAVALGSDGAAHAAAQPDYGVSCVLAAGLGALLTRRGDRTSRVIGIAGTAVLLPFSVSWYGSEHLLAVAFGAAAAIALRGDRRHEP